MPRLLTTMMLLLLPLVVMMMMIVMIVVGDDDDDPRYKHRYAPSGSSASPRYRCVMAWRRRLGVARALRARAARARMGVMTHAHIGDQVLVLETIPLCL